MNDQEIFNYPINDRETKKGKGLSSTSEIAEKQEIISKLDKEFAPSKPTRTIISVKITNE